MRLVFTLLSALLPGFLLAQVFMRPFDNAANLALGGAASAQPTLSNGLANPAQLGQPPRVGAWVWSALPYSIAGWQSHGAQAVVKAGKRSGFGLSLWHAGIEGYREQRADLAYGRQLGSKIAFGGSVQVLRVSADEYGAQTGLTATLGLLARPLPKVWLAAQVQNPAPQKLGTATLSNLLRIGAAWQISDKFLISSEIEKDLERPAQVRGGFEYRPSNLLRLRAGVRSQPTRTAFGAGFHLKNGLSLDFGSEWHPTLGMTPAAMVGWVW